MELSDYELQLVHDLFEEISTNIKDRQALSGQRRYGRTVPPYFPNPETIKKRLYCWFLDNSLDEYLLEDLAFLRDPDGFNKPEEERDFAPPREGEFERLIDGFFPLELIPKLAEVEPDEDDPDWWDYVMEHATHLHHLEGTGFYGWVVDLYEYKERYFVQHEAGVNWYDTYKEAKAQLREA